MDRHDVYLFTEKILDGNDFALSRGFLTRQKKKMINNVLFWIRFRNHQLNFDLKSKTVRKYDSSCQGLVRNKPGNVYIF